MRFVRAHKTESLSRTKRATQHSNSNKTKWISWFLPFPCRRVFADCRGGTKKKFKGHDCRDWLVSLGGFWLLSLSLSLALGPPSFFPRYPDKSRRGEFQRTELNHLRLFVSPSRIFLFRVMQVAQYHVFFFPFFLSHLDSKYSRASFVM